MANYGYYIKLESLQCPMLIDKWGLRPVMKYHCLTRTLPPDISPEPLTRLLALSDIQMICHTLGHRSCKHTKVHIRISTTRRCQIWKSQLCSMNDEYLVTTPTNDLLLRLHTHHIFQIALMPLMQPICGK